MHRETKIAAAVAGVLAVALAASLLSRPDNREDDRQCGRSAEAAYRGMGLATQAENPFDASGFENHYNDKLKRCFVKTEENRFMGEMQIQTVKVVDADEHRDWARFSALGKNLLGATPTECSILTPGTEMVRCNSRGEFDKLVEPLMTE